jgi:23S rRNA (adenine2030-N6)-methyltransferase
MNYRHIFHAGNRCDVVKHAVLTLILGHLLTKDKGFVIIDTHAGSGLYDLADTRALKTNEAAQGIGFLLDALPLPALVDYYKVLRKVNPLWDGAHAEGMRTYPGSPLVAFHLLREQDRVAACELHPEEAEALRIHSPANKRLQIHTRDGYEALSALLPPPEKRGLVLIDPPYEHHVVAHLTQAWKRWPTGIYAVWYPIKERPAIWRFHEALTTSGIGKILAAEFIYEEETRADRLNGSGLIIVNPPWKFDAQLSALFPELHRAMKTSYHGVTVKHLVG